jgi:hypothetical protein
MSTVAGSFRAGMLVVGMLAAATPVAVAAAGGPGRPGERGAGEEPPVTGPEVAGPEGEGAEGEGLRPADDADRLRLERIALYLEEVEKPRNVYSEGGLKLSAAVVPDSLARRLCAMYLAERKRGRNHDGAAAALAGEVGGLKKLRGRPLVKLVIENPGHELPGRTRRIYTAGEKLPGRAITLAAGKKTLPLAFAEKPENLREASVRIKKFYKVGGQRRIPDPDNPQGFEPLLSKPMKVLVLEKDPATLELLAGKLDVGAAGPLDLRLAGLKKYEGPFAGDEIDLNGGRRWEEITPLSFRLELPPEGVRLPEAVENLVRELDR